MFVNRVPQNRVSHFQTTPKKHILGCVNLSLIPHGYIYIYIHKYNYTSIIINWYNPMVGKLVGLIIQVLSIHTNTMRLSIYWLVKLFFYDSPRPAPEAAVAEAPAARRARRGAVPAAVLAAVGGLVPGGEYATVDWWICWLRMADELENHRKTIGKP